MVLGSSSSRPILIRHLLTQLSGVADQLWRLVQVTPLPDPSSLSLFSCCFLVSVNQNFSG